MGDVGGELFDGVHAQPQGVGHVAQRAGKLADFITPAGEVGDQGLAPGARAHGLRGAGEAAHGARDSAREIEREHHGDGERDAEGLEDGEPRFAHLALDVGGRCAQHEHGLNLLEVLDRHRDGDHEAPVQGFLDGAAAFALERPPVFRMVERVVVVGRQVDARRQALDNPEIDDLGEAREPARARRVGQRFGLDQGCRARERAAVDDQVVFGAEQAGPAVARQDEASEQVAGGVRVEREHGSGRVRDRRAAAQRPGDQLALGGERLDFGLEQIVLVLVEIKQAEGEDNQRPHVDRQDLGHQRPRRHPPGPAPARRVRGRDRAGRVSRCCSDNRRRRGFRCGQIRDQSL